MARKIGAVITGGDFQALGVLRNLARKDIPVILLESDRCISRYSRFGNKLIRSPHPSEKESYLNFLIDLARKEKIHGWVIFPNSDASVYVLSKYKDILDKFYRIPTPPWEVIRNVYVKENTYRLAEKHEILVPKTYYPKSQEELTELDLQYPVVIKPSVREPFFSKFKVKAFKIHNENELKRKYQWVCSLIDPSEILIQDFIPSGPANLYSFCPLFKDGKTITSITAKRIRQHPMDFGQASTFAELIDVPEIKGLSEKFLRLIGFYGIAEVEFMRDPRDGEYKLLEINPRIWGWHSLAIAAGIDLPYFLYQDSIGEEIDVQPPLNGLKWVRLVTDIPTAFIEILRGRMKITDYLISMRGKKEFAVFSLDDPLPFFAEIGMIPYLWRKKGF